MFPEPCIAADCTEALSSFQILGTHTASIPDNHMPTALAKAITLELPTVVSESLPQ
jgi:hypothetical protein